MRLVVFKRRFFILLLMGWLFVTSAATNSFGQSHKFIDSLYGYLENPEMVAINQEAGHTTIIPYRNAQEALAGHPRPSASMLSLNGNWKFHWSANPDSLPSRFYERQFNDRNWNNLPVPSNWEMHGYGDAAFRNVRHPFPIYPPFIPRDYNPVGLYRKEINLPAAWKQQEVFLHLEAATSASFVWINGKEVGYNAGANEPAEYNITRYLKSGKNLITVAVFKYSAGTYLEDQDMWRLGGIFRDVYLIARPKVHIRDYFVTTPLDSLYQHATINISGELTNLAAYTQRGLRIRAGLYNQQKKPVWQNELSHVVNISARGTAVFEMKADVKRPDKWSAEHPNLYFLTLELLDSSGRTVEAIMQPIGFKKVEVRKQALLVNGVPVKLNGVNSHMQHPALGHTMDTATIRKDLTLMKQFNINCVRTSHYPPTVDYLRMADELGLYVIDETGNEAHATPELSDKPEWRTAYLDRVQRMILRDRNHPSILFWSAGNESGEGKNICASIQEGKRLDPTRLFMFGGNTDDWVYKNEVPCEDIIGPRYPTPFELLTRIAQVPDSVDSRPSFMDEYLSVEGNAGGGLDDYWDVIYKYPRCIGGAIWDWVSPGIHEQTLLLKDKAAGQIHATIKGRGRLVPGRKGKAVELSGHEQWIDVYRHPALDIATNALSLSLWIFPRQWNTDGTFLTKGSYQFGLLQASKDSLQFYLTSNKREQLTVLLPDGWEGKWHHIAAVYDGTQMELYVDGMLLGSQPCTGNIANKPFPVNLGRNAEIEAQEYSGRYSNALFDHVSVYSKALPAALLMEAAPALIPDAALWLDFDEVEDKGTMYGMGVGGRTYGLVWPNRTPQPELWQVKKSAQPVKVTLADAADGTIEIENRHQFTNLSAFTLKWQLQANGKALQQGEKMVDLPAQQTSAIRIPYNKSLMNQAAEYFLLVSFVTNKAQAWAPAGFEVAWEQLLLPSTTTHAVPAVNFRKELRFLENERSITVSGNDFEYRFSKDSGRLVAMKYHQKNLIADGPRLNVWRAPLANELDKWALIQSHLTYQKPGMGDGPVNNWRSLGLDNLEHKVVQCTAQTNAAGQVEISIEAYAAGIFQGDNWYDHFAPGFSSKYLYTIDASGKITITHTVTPNGLMPAWLQRMGLQWTLSKELQQVNWYGRGPFENYPDRKTGAKIGNYSTTVDAMKEPYILPQDYGLRTDVRLVQFQSSDVGIEFSGSDLFNFNAYPYTTEQLERARYQYQLQESGSTTFNFDYATSGVGCTAVSVLNQYRVLPVVYHFTSTIQPYITGK